MHSRLPAKTNEERAGRGLQVWVRPEVVRIGKLGEVAQYNPGNGNGPPRTPPGQCKKLGLICS